MKSYAKLNIFLKITGTRGNYHEISSRFILYKSLFDKIYFEKSEFQHSGEDLNIISNIKINGENIINKAFKELLKTKFKDKISDFFKTHKVILEKNIPMGAGLGGGSSNAAAFLNLTNQTLNLNFSKKELIEISKNIGSDVAFFITEFESANVSGVGEIVENFNDDIPNLEVFTPSIFASTPEIYAKFRADFMNKIDLNLAKKLKNLSTKEILKKYKNYELNDLLAPFQAINPNFKLKKNEFFSGSGSSYFKIKGKIWKY